MPENRLAFELAATFEKRQQAFAIQRFVRGNFCSRRRQKGWIKVYVVNRRRVRCISFDNARPVGNERFADAAFVITTFVASQRFLRRLLRPAIVRRENEQRIFIEAKLFQLIEQQAYAVVQVVKTRSIECVLVLRAGLFGLEFCERSRARFQRNFLINFRFIGAL